MRRQVGRDFVLRSPEKRNRITRTGYTGPPVARLGLASGQRGLALHRGARAVTRSVLLVLPGMLFFELRRRRR